MNNINSSYTVWYDPILVLDFSVNSRLCSGGTTYRAGGGKFGILGVGENLPRR